MLVLNGLKLSYSSLGTYIQCPYKFKLSRIDGLKTIFDGEPANALVIGRAFHRGIETDTKTAIDEYFKEYPVIDDKHIEEAIKLEHLIEEAKALLPDGLHEVKIETEDYIGFIDLLVPVGDNTFDLYDFKYASKIDRYLESEQLHVYKYFFEKANPDKKIGNLYYLFAPKTSIRLKKSETLEEFRKRLSETLADKKCRIVPIEYDPAKVEEFLANADKMRNAEEFPKNVTRLCGWCEFEEYCKEGIDYMILPKNERIQKTENKKKKIYLYGAPFTGKTHLANEFPNVLFLSSDGNYTNLPGGIPPHIDIKDVVTVEGRLTKRTYAWEVFKEVIAELEKKQNDYQTIVLDLLEDAYESCRQYIFQKYSIQHESDSGYGKGWDLVKTEFLTQIKKFTTLDYDNLILISHEDVSKDLTKKSGDKITQVKPNIKDGLAIKIAGMTDVVIRTINDDGNYQLSFKTDEYTFGGGRLKMQHVKTIPASYEELCKVYENSKN